MLENSFQGNGIGSHVINYNNYLNDQFPGIEGVSAFSIVSNWLRYAISTNTPSSLVISPLQLTPYTLPSIHDHVIQYVPQNPFQWGSHGGSVLHYHNGEMNGEIASIDDARQTDAIMTHVLEMIMTMIRQPGMKTIGKIVGTPLNHFSEKRTKYTYKISDLILDDHIQRKY
jgi:hypothetical protein